MELAAMDNRNIANHVSGSKLFIILVPPLDHLASLTRDLMKSLTSSDDRLQPLCSLVLV
jgi:hypothetical protein